MSVFYNNVTHIVVSVADSKDSRYPLGLWSPYTGQDLLPTPSAGGALQEIAFDIDGAPYLIGV
jgi:hypothetical protein